MSQDWSNTEEIDKAFYGMKGLDDLSASIPETARSGVMASLSKTFSLPIMPDLGDEAMRKVFILSRMKLDTLPDQAAARATFVQLVSAAIKGSHAPEVSKLQERPVPQVENPEDVGAEQPVVARPAVDRSPSPRSQANQASHDLDPEPAHSKSPVRPSTRAVRPAPTTAAEPPTREADQGRVQVPLISLFADPVDNPEPLTSEFADLLLPRPPAKDHSALSRWISGHPWAANTLVITFPDTATNSAKVIEQEAEMSQATETYLGKLEAFEALGADPLLREINPKGHGRWLIAEGGSRIERVALHAFAEAVGEAIGMLSPVRQSKLKAHGAQLNLGPDAARVICAAWRLQHDFLEETKGEAGRQRQNILGTPHPEHRLDQNLAIRRAAFMHVVLGTEIADALGESLADLRMAQVLRVANEEGGEALMSEAQNVFNANFFTTCRLPVGSYRLARNEPEMAP